MAVWIQVPINMVDHIYTISDPLRNQQGKEPHVDQKRNMRMPEIMDSNHWYICFLCPLYHPISYR